MRSQTLYLLAGLAAAGALYWYSRTKSGSAAVDASTGGALQLLDVTTSRIVNAVTSRGYRNNNPGNLRYLSNNPWNGQVSDDSGYGVYDSPASGTRALGHQLLKYANSGANTVRSIIARWAPPAENNTESYIGDVSTALNVGPDDQIYIVDRLADLAEAIARHENGYIDSGFNFQDVYLI